MSRALLKPAPLNPSEVKNISVNVAGQDLSIAYREAGNPKGELLVLLHNNSGSKEAFLKQLQDRNLTKNFHVLVLDLPGHGQSSDANKDNPQDIYSLPGYAETVVNVLKRLGHTKDVHLAGWSLGGHVAMEIAAQNPELVKSLAVTGAPPTEVSPAGFAKGFKFQEPTEGSKLLFHTEKFTQEQAIAFATSGGVDIAEAPFAVAAGMRTDPRARGYLGMSMQKGIGTDEEAFIKKCTIPYTFICGKNDPGVNNEYIASVSKSTTVVESNHAVPLNAARQFSAALVENIARSNPKQSIQLGGRL